MYSVPEMLVMYSVPAVSLAIGAVALVAMWKWPRTYWTASCVAAAAVSLFIGSVSVWGFEGSGALTVILAAEMSIPLGALVLAAALHHGVLMQSPERAMIESGSEVTSEDARFAEVPTRASRRSGGTSGWDRCTMPIGACEKAMLARALPNLVYFEAVIVAVVIGFPAVFVLPEDGQAIPGLLLCLASLAPILAFLAQRRVQMGGVVKDKDDRWTFQALDPIRPWIGVQHLEEPPMFVHRALEATWLGYASKRPGVHTLVIALEQGGAAPAGVPELDPTSWPRMVWLGMRPRLR